MEHRFIHSSYSNIDRAIQKIHSKKIQKIMKIPKKDYLRIKVIPKSPKNEVTEIMKDESGEETIKIRIKAIPEKGKANTELIKFLSQELAIPKSNISRQDID